MHGVHTNVPQYIIGKLGLNRDPLAELQQDMSQLDTSNESTSTGDSSRKDSSEAPASNSETECVSDTDANSKTPKVETSESLKDPSDDDFDIIKLIVTVS